MYNYTVAELKEFLRVRNLVTTGTKADLISRLEQCDANIWQSIAEENSWVAERTARDEEARRRAAAEESTTLRSEGHLHVSQAEVQQQLDDPVRREMELLRRERDILQREVELFRRESAGSRNPSTDSTRTGSTGSMDSRRTATDNLSIRVIGDLLREFDGNDNTFWKWEQQVDLLRTSYQLHENASRVLISSKLKGRAASWFHSKAEHLTLTIVDLLGEMKIMFDYRPTQVALRQEFQDRTWKSGEKFTDYYHDKLILANQVPIPSAEVVDYLIDGVPDVPLRDHARMMCFKTTGELLGALEKISLEARKSADRDTKEKKEIKGSSGKEKEKVSSLPPRKPVKCFNCQEVGHISTKCPKPKRQRGTCFECGSTSHRIADCPQRASNRRGESSTAGEPSATTSANVVQPEVLSAPYMVSLSYTVFDKSGHSCKYTISAMLDSGLPISLIKNSFVPLDARTPVTGTEQDFCGINGSRLQILGNFYHVVEIEGVPIKLKFYIVPDDTMAFMAILGRDFSSHSSVEVMLNGNRVVTRRVQEAPATELDCGISQTMNIECVNNLNTTRKNLQINLKLDDEVIKKIKDLYNLDYTKVKESSVFETDFEMKIV
ncbi:uncharacterized protein LOC143368757 [Andrena cerasifolii]|uniref:uncharacterized protein LOC143368757 n=1 Tax=Andrena cerasifolii TaxID=2819439 RepID=UPI0040377BB5